MKNLSVLEAALNVRPLSSLLDLFFKKIMINSSQILGMFYIKNYT